MVQVAELEADWLFNEKLFRSSGSVLQRVNTGKQKQYTKVFSQNDLDTPGRQKAHRRCARKAALWLKQETEATRPQDWRPAKIATACFDHKSSLCETDGKIDS